MRPSTRALGGLSAAFLLVAAACSSSSSPSNGVLGVTSLPSFAVPSLPVSLPSGLPSALPSNLLPSGLPGSLPSGLPSLAIPSGLLPSTAPLTGNVVLQANTSQAGTYLTDPSGKALYFFANDGPDVSNCNGQCASIWPPLTETPGTQVTGPTQATMAFGTVTRADGTTQVTYNHRPLYTFRGDLSSGTAMGQGLQGLWWVADVSGNLPAGSSGAGASAGTGTGSTMAPAASPTTGY